MNDFTKEELELMKLAVSDLVIIDGEDSKQSSLYRKIQSMIENYCEHNCKHENDGLIYTSNPPQNKCIKCREFYR